MDKTYDPMVFKGYDIRGKVPEDIDGDFAEQVGRAFANKLKPKAVVVGRDVRLTGPELKSRTIAGITKSGIDAIDIGVVSTDAYYYACAKLGLPGIMVTASHNPSEFNGYKMVREMPHLMLASEFKPDVLEKTYVDAEQEGRVTEQSILDEFIDHILSIVPPENLTDLKVVVDTSNGAQGPIWDRMVKKLPIRLVRVCFEPDGNFPNHGNDVIQPANQEMLREAVKKEHADLGLIFDPDGDRCLAVDDRGQTVPGDFITALLAVGALKHHPGSTIIYDIRASDAVPEMTKAAGGKPFGWKIGHAYIKSKMQELDAVFGGEVSGHFYFKDFWFADCGLLAGLTILEYVSGLKKKLSEEVAELERKHHISGEINSTVVDVDLVIDRIKQKYADAQIDELDGVAIRYPDWHFVVRPSNNDPLLRLTLEAKTKELMEEKRDEVLALIRS